MQEIFEPDISDEEALQNFLLDVDCLDELLPWTGKFNLFDVLNISKTEICHSDVLAWLLNPNENHGIGDTFLKSMIQKLVEYANNGRYDADLLSCLDYYSFNVYREWKDIDLVLVSMDEQMVIAIENKVGTAKFDQELGKYRAALDHDFPDYKKVLVFLSAEGALPNDVEYWDTLTYMDVAACLETVNTHLQLQPDVELMIRNYIEIVRRDIVDDQQLMEICNKIYNKHKKALDLIFENRFDGTNQVGYLIKDTLKEMAKSGRILFDPNQKSGTYIVFHTKEMDEYLPPLSEANSSYRTNRVYCYGITVKDKAMYAYFELGGYNTTDEHKETMKKMISLHKPNDKMNEDFKFKRILRTKPFGFEDTENLEANVRGAVEAFVDELLIMETQLLFNLDALDMIDMDEKE